jgi:drug/metabolite transporter (DMT)-like permease
MAQHTRTPGWAIALVLATTVLVSAAQGLFKLSTTLFPDRLDVAGLLAILTNLPLWGALVLYGFAWLGLMISLKHGELSVLYPLIALSFVWVAGISRIFFGEAITAFKVMGVIAIIAGISCVGFGSQHRKGRIEDAPVEVA